jgi:ABC-type dipeptide/oligopeptide/nickel transport system permease subunit
MWRHLRPNVTAPILVIATFNLSTAIIQEASLSFLGVGTPANIPSWGQMLSGESRKFMLVQPWLAVWPGLAITVSVLAWNFLGDALRDLWDPRLRREG